MGGEDCCLMKVERRCCLIVVANPGRQWLGMVVPASGWSRKKKGFFLFFNF